MEFLTTKTLLDRVLFSLLDLGVRRMSVFRSSSMDSNWSRGIGTPEQSQKSYHSSLRPHRAGHRKRAKGITRIATPVFPYLSAHALNDNCFRYSFELKAAEQRFWAFQ